MKGRNLCFMLACLFAMPGVIAIEGCAPSAAGRGYKVVHGWPVLPEGDSYLLGEAAGVAVDSHNHVFVFHRGGSAVGNQYAKPGEKAGPSAIERATVFVFEGETGRIYAQWGEGRFVRPHGLKIDSENNVWLTDVALHQVFKFSHDGQLQLTVGEAGVPGDDETHFNQPTDIAVLPDGSFYVSDGYGNSRVIKFSAEGEYEFEWGVKGSGKGEFHLPHAIDRDSRGRIYVTDRENKRVQIFTAGGEFLSSWQGPELGHIYALRIAPDGQIFAVDGGDLSTTGGKFIRRSSVMLLDSLGMVIARFGRLGRYDGQFITAHDLAVAADGSVYVVDIFGKRVQKFVPYHN